MGDTWAPVETPWSRPVGWCRGHTNGLKSAAPSPLVVVTVTVFWTENCREGVNRLRIPGRGERPHAEGGYGPRLVPTVRGSVGDIQPQ